MALTIFLFAAGIALLLFGGNFFVKSSVDLAERMRLPRMVIGGTIVAVATTTPEFVVSVTASLEGNPDLAMGNAVGSVIVNIGLIVALLALLRPFKVSSRQFGFPAWVMFGVVLVIVALSWDLSMSRWKGAVLLAGGIGYLFLSYFRGSRNHGAWDGEAGPGSLAAPRPMWRTVLFFLLGLGMVVGGSELTVESGVAIAGAIGVPPIVIGLTLVALGTSLPELATAVASTRSRVPDLSLGNLIGANVLNLTLIAGTAATVEPFALQRQIQVYSFPAMLVITAAVVAMGWWGGKMSRRDGGVLLGLYAAYLGGLAVVSL